ncbi:hypothetical protein FC80_GL001743 [Liquorilactobacillus cacaonum DSM 21116]|uniref:Uncharacterized protein n=1 Tax=Liquorilactobacillus cacaonum DSM 21116 TaxID=1423729 RepID=A0A0R2CDV7_9LACO|nr:hypothetical protein FC80_GL001743 [Liquorilactobacillus cacaonum DSM 21116]
MKGGKKMSQNTHVGVANDRRPVNQKNIKKRREQHQAVLSFLKGREELEKTAK